MMLYHPRTPLIFGIAAILLLAAYLAFRQPMPGPLAAAHEQVKVLSTLSGCSECHAEKGLDAGCLSCHEEIAAQLKQKTGYHHHLMKDGEEACQACHQEHLGKQSQLVNHLSWKNDPTQFDHPHVDFALEGRHRTLECTACHRAPFAGRTALRRFAGLKRKTTFLGLSQACVQCHQDVHAGGRSGDCQSCHGQESFRPAVRFDHAKFFKLVGAHERAACDGCHVIRELEQSRAEAQRSGKPAAYLPFANVRGTTCAECHRSPHRTPLGKDCEQCHAGAAPHWAEGGRFVTAAVHEATGFRLAPPHQSVACAECHRPELPFDRKYPDPSLAGYLRREETCQGCHRDIHAGQFEARYEGCLGCHEALGFQPHRFGRKEHAAKYPLSGAHGAVPCQECHRVQEPSGVRQFAGTSSACQSCHGDAHGGQFAAELREGDCSACHAGNAITFAIRPFDHEKRTGYALLGAHAGAECEQCHRAEKKGASPLVVRYRGISSACGSCHVDIHRGQFVESQEVRCERCHQSTSGWRPAQFDHNTQAGFALTGVHAKVRCGGCHPKVELAGGVSVVQYKPLGKECRNCHGLIKQ